MNIIDFFYELLLIRTILIFIIIKFIVFNFNGLSLIVHQTTHTINETGFRLEFLTFANER